MFIPRPGAHKMGVCLYGLGGKRNLAGKGRVARRILGGASSAAVTENRGAEAPRLFHQQDRACAFDFAGDFPVHVRRHTRDSTRKDFSAFGNELLEKIGVLVVDSLSRNIDATTRHDAVCSTEIRSAFSGFRFHGLFGLPVQRVPAEKRVVFLFF